MLHQRLGMNQFRFDALIRIAHDHFIAVSEDGRFDRSYHSATSSNVGNAFNFIQFCGTILLSEDCDLGLYGAERLPIEQYYSSRKTTIFVQLWNIPELGISEFKAR
jgi:hypothetical protein